MKKIDLTFEQVARVADWADEKWLNGNVHSARNVSDVLDLAKHVLGREAPEIFQMRIDVFELHGEDFRLHVQVDQDLYLATRMLHIGDFDQNNGKPIKVAVEYVLRTLLYFHNGLVTKAKEAF